MPNHALMTKKLLTAIDSLDTAESFVGEVAKEGDLHDRVNFNRLSGEIEHVKNKVISCCEEIEEMEVY